MKIKNYQASKQKHLLAKKYALNIILALIVARSEQFSESDSWGKLWSSRNEHCQTFVSIFDIFEAKMEGFVLNIKHFCQH